MIFHSYVKLPEGTSYAKYKNSPEVDDRSKVSAGQVMTHPPQEGPIRNLKGTSAGSLQKRVAPCFNQGGRFVTSMYFEIKLEYVVPKISQTTKEKPPLVSKLCFYVSIYNFSYGFFENPYGYPYNVRPPSDVNLVLDSPQ